MIEDIPTKEIPGNSIGLPKNIIDMIKEKRKLRRQYIHHKDSMLKIKINKLQNEIKKNIIMYKIYKWNLYGGKTTMLYLHLSDHDTFKKRFGTSLEKHCLTAMPYHLFSRKLAKLT